MARKGSRKAESIGSLAAGESRLEVAVGGESGEESIALQLSCWSEDLGWQAQKTIRLPADQLGSLQRLLSRARARIEDRRGNEAMATARIIEFAAREANRSIEPARSQPSLQPRRAGAAS
jgi:hypothetical protein